MSRPGYWTTKDGREVPYAELEDYHLKNILRMLRNRYLGTEEPRQKQLFERSLIEMGEEAQRRNLVVQGDSVPFEVLLATIKIWQDNYDARKPSSIGGTNSPYLGLVAGQVRRASVTLTYKDIAKELSRITDIQLAEQDMQHLEERRLELIL
jgi:hypothetical protein